MSFLVVYSDVFEKGGKVAMNAQEFLTQYQWYTAMTIEELQAEVEACKKDSNGKARLETHRRFYYCKLAKEYWILHARALQSTSIEASQRATRYLLCCNILDASQGKQDAYTYVCAQAQALCELTPYSDIFTSFLQKVSR